jgi:Xaa-Pro aminopeptidase
MGYAGDLSSTFPVGQTFSNLQKDIYTLVLKSHNACVDALKPGITFKEVHRAACLTITEGLKSMGLMKGDTESAVETGAHALFFPCGTGHMMGLDIHDMERSQNKFTEYLNYDEIDKFRNFGGIRNEENYLITPEGKRLLGNKKKPMLIEEVEALRK